MSEELDDTMLNICRGKYQAFVQLYEEQQINIQELNSYIWRLNNELYDQNLDYRFDLYEINP